MYFEPIARLLRNPKIAEREETRSLEFIQAETL